MNSSSSLSSCQAPGGSPSQDLGEEQQALLVQLCVVHLQAFLQASHHCLNPYLTRKDVGQGSGLCGSSTAPQKVMGLAPPSSAEKPATAMQLTKQGSRVWFGFYLPPPPKNTGPTVPTIHRVAFGKEERFFSQEDQAAAAGPDKCFIGRGKMFKEELWPRKGERMKASHELWAFGLTPPPLTQHLTCPFCLQEM